MSSQVTDLRSIELEAWINFLRAHAAVTRQFNAELLATHALTINDLAERVLLTPSGITRLLKGLEEAGWISNRPCAEDARVTYAVLTPAGKKKLEQARKTHVASVRALFSERFDHDELETLALLLERLPHRDDPCD